MTSLQAIYNKSHLIVFWAALTLFLLNGGSATAMEIKSAAFQNSADIPRKYTCDGTDASPPRYFFKLYALDGPTNLKPRASKQQLLDAIKGHILADSQLMGRYKR